MIKTNPGILQEGMKEWTKEATLPPNVSASDLKTAIASLVNFFLILSIALIVHVPITFHLMRRYRHVFEPERMDLEQ